jgi:DNA-binding CsgD family transcriptional regulator
MKEILQPRTQLVAVLIVQFFCLVFLILDVGADLAGLDGQENFAENHYFELIVIIALVLSIVVIARELRRLMDRNRHVEEQLKIASGAFHELLNQNFDAWDLTGSEKDVALLAIKGLGIQEISEIRVTKQGTVKAQLNAIYRKAGVNGRPQLISIFVEELMADGLAPNSNN